jgi:hypothetical protein
VDFSSLQAFVKSGLEPAGAGALLGALLYFFIPWMAPIFETLPGLAKRWIVFGICLLIPTALLAVSHFVLGNAVTPDAGFGALVAWLSAFGSSQMVQAKDLGTRSAETQLGHAVLAAYQNSLTQPADTQTRSFNSQSNLGDELADLVGKFVLR